MVAKVQGTDGRRGRAATRGSGADRVPPALTDREGIDRLAGRGVRRRSRWSRSADHPRAVDGRALVAGTVSGYKSALLAADRLPRFLPMLMTAAGTVLPGEGARARRRRRRASGDRDREAARRGRLRLRRAPRGAEQVESLGAAFLDLGVVGEETAGGYARELTEEEQRRQQEELARRIPEFDAVITTAAIPGRAAPRLIPAAAVRGCARLGDRRPRGGDRRQLRADRAPARRSSRAA